MKMRFLSTYDSILITKYVVYEIWANNVNAK